jgi:hypothetical protein
MVPGTCSWLACEASSSGRIPAPELTSPDPNAPDPNAPDPNAPQLNSLRNRCCRQLSAARPREPSTMRFTLTSLVLSISIGI